MWQPRTRKEVVPMDTVSLLPVNQLLCYVLNGALFDCSGVVRIYHLRCGRWTWNKISVRRRCCCLRRLDWGFQIIPVYKIPPITIRLPAYRVPCVHGKCTRFISKSQVFLRICYEIRVTLWFHKRLLDIIVRLRRTVLGYNTGIFYKNLSPVRERRTIWAK